MLHASGEAALLDMLDADGELLLDGKVQFCRDLRPVREQDAVAEEHEHRPLADEGDVMICAVADPFGMTRSAGNVVDGVVVPEHGGLIAVPAPLQTDGVGAPSGLVEEHAAVSGRIGSDGEIHLDGEILQSVQRVIDGVIQPAGAVEAELPAAEHGAASVGRRRSAADELGAAQGSVEGEKRPVARKFAGESDRAAHQRPAGRRVDEAGLGRTLKGGVDGCGGGEAPELRRGVVSFRLPSAQYHGLLRIGDRRRADRELRAPVGGVVGPFPARRSAAGAVADAVPHRGFAELGSVNDRPAWTAGVVGVLEADHPVVGGGVLVDPVGARQILGIGGDGVGAVGAFRPGGHVICLGGDAGDGHAPDADESGTVRDVLGDLGQRERIRPTTSPASPATLISTGNIEYRHPGGNVRAYEVRIPGNDDITENIFSGTGGYE